MRDLLIKDWGWKLFSLILAVGIWVTVHRIIDPRTTGVVAAGNPVTYDNLPVLIVSAAADVRDFRVAPGVVSVTVNGSPDVMSVLEANQIRATVDLTDIESAKDLKRRVDVSVPSGVTLVSVDPPRVGVIVPPKH